MSDTWYPGALVERGPAWKQGQSFQTVRHGHGAVVHSAEGWLHGTFSVLHSDRRASWHFTIAQDGRIFQHYPAETITWHAGQHANPYYVGIECEGIAGQDLTEPQLYSLAAVLRWLSALDEWPSHERGETLFEHNEYMATACPSGRIPWDRLIDLINESEDEPEDTWPPEAPTPPAEEGGQPGPSVDAQLLALQAAAAVLWVHHNYDHLPAWDREVLREILSRL